MRYLVRACWEDERGEADLTRVIYSAEHVTLKVAWDDWARVCKATVPEAYKEELRNNSEMRRAVNMRQGDRSLLCVVIDLLDVTRPDDPRQIDVWEYTPRNWLNSPAGADPL